MEERIGSFFNRTSDLRSECYFGRMMGEVRVMRDFEAGEKGGQQSKMEKSV